MGREFIVDTGYQGYVFLSRAQGMFETQGGQKRPHCNMYVFSLVSSYSITSQHFQPCQVCSGSISAHRFSS